MSHAQFKLKFAQHEQDIEKNCNTVLGCEMQVHHKLQLRKALKTTFAVERV